MKDSFKHSDKAFVAGENRIYIGELLPNPVHTDVSNYMTGGRRLSMVGAGGVFASLQRTIGSHAHQRK